MIRLALLACLSAACGGVSEERVGALESQLSQMKTDDTAKLDALTERVAAVETSMNESVGKLEDSLGAVKLEVKNLGAASAAPAPKAAAPAGGGSGVWYSVDALFGVKQPGVTVDGDTYLVKRGWLAAEVEMLAASGKAPKLAASKKGVVVKGVKPKTLPALLGLANLDVITAIGGTTVDDPTDIATALREADGSVAVRLQRKAEELVLTYKLVD
jgi:hypothetical protein